MQSSQATSLITQNPILSIFIAAILLVFLLWAVIKIYRLNRVKMVCLADTSETIYPSMESGAGGGYVFSSHTSEGKWFIAGSEAERDFRDRYSGILEDSGDGAYVQGSVRVVKTKWIKKEDVAKILHIR